LESSGRALKCVLPDRLIAIPIHLFPAAKLNHRRDIVTKSSKLPTTYIERRERRETAVGSGTLKCPD